jgi:hypothetical protein
LRGCVHVTDGGRLRRPIKLFPEEDYDDGVDDDVGVDVDRVEVQLRRF